MTGMARLMLTSLIQKKIRDLSATYLTLSFNDIAQKTELLVDSLEGSLTKMVQSKSIKARINKKQGTVDFIDSEEDAMDGSLVNQSNFDMIKLIESQNVRIVKLLGSVHDVNERIRHSDDYIVAKGRKSIKTSSGAADEDMEEDN